MKRMMILAVVLLVSLPVMSQAQRGGQQCEQGPMGRGPGMQCDHGPGGPGGGMRHPQMDGIKRLMMLADEIGLTEKQQDQLKDMQSDFAMDRVDRKAALEKAEITLHGLMRDEAPEADIMRAIDDVSRLRGDMQKMRYQHRMAVQNVLTDEQKDKLKELRNERRGQFRQQLREHEPPGEGRRMGGSGRG